MCRIELVTLPHTYVNYYTRTLMNKGDNPPIGVFMYAEKNDAVVKYTLPEGNNQIFISKYFIYLPTEEELSVNCGWMSLERSMMNKWYQSIIFYMDNALFILTYP